MLMTVSSALSDDDLIAAIDAWARTERTATAALIAHLAELEARNLHLAAGFRSLFGYCRHVLHCSEHESYNRMEAVHAARRFPVILALLAEGRLHLTAVRLLAPHLKDEDHLALLGGAIHKSKRKILVLLARWFPSADLPSSVRQLPMRIGKATGVPAPRGGAILVTPSKGLEDAGGGVPAGSTPGARTMARPAVTPPPDRGAVAPLSPHRYRLQVTLDDEAHDDLRWLQDAMRREVPDGDPAALVKRALRMMRGEFEKKTFSATSRPRQPRASRDGSRDIPAHVERAVWARDQGQCAFEGARRRCAERTYLEYHHLTPWVVGGAPSVENIALRCRAHNGYEAAVYFGPIRAAMDEGMNSFRNESR